MFTQKRCFSSHRVFQNVCAWRMVNKVLKTHVHPTFYVNAQKMVQMKGKWVWKYHSTSYFFFCNTLDSYFFPFTVQDTIISLTKATFVCGHENVYYSCSAFILHLIQFSHYFTLVTGAQVTAVNMRKWTEKVTDWECMCVLATVMPVSVTILCLQHSL